MDSESIGDDPPAWVVFTSPSFFFFFFLKLLLTEVLMTTHSQLLFPFWHTIMVTFNIQRLNKGTLLQQLIERDCLIIAKKFCHLQSPK